MKRLKKMMALIIAVAMVLGMTSMAAFAAPTANSHTITIANTDQNVDHTYAVYQVFSGNLNAEEDVLSDIQWGSSITNGANLIAALQASSDLVADAAYVSSTTNKAAGKDALGNDIAVGANIFANCTTAQDVAKVLATLSSTATFTDSTKTLDGTTENAGMIDTVATIIAGDPNDTTNFPGFLSNVAAADANNTASAFVQDGKNYAANVYGDGYYLIKDTTETLSVPAADGTASDTRAKYMLSVVRDETIVAKDTGLTPEKKILDAVNGEATTTKVDADSSAIGDTVTFDVEVVVPNTRKYQDHFWFVMKDKLPEGITFTGITSVKIGSAELTETTKAGTAAETVLTAVDDNGKETYAGTPGYYTLKIAGKDQTADDATAPTLVSGDYPWKASTYDAVKEDGGQYIELDFRQFKKFVETNDLIGQTVVVKYTGVVNDDAKYKPSDKNENSVTFDYSNDPNHDYDGDNPGPDDDNVTGTTPASKTRTYTTSLKIKKVGDDGTTALEGATFKLSGTALNRTVLTGYKFVKEADKPAEPTNGEEYEAAANYWELKDGSYTTTDPSTVANTTQYKNTAEKWYKVTYDYDEVATQATSQTVVTDSNGIAEFTGLREGTYYLEEIAAPDGYNKIDGVSKITVTWSDPEAEGAAAPAKDQNGFTLTEAAAGATLTTADDGAEFNGKKTYVFQIEWDKITGDNDPQFEAVIKNQSGSALPSTGGIGTTIFYVVGTILVIGAGVVLITRRRMDA